MFKRLRKDSGATITMAHDASTSSTAGNGVQRPQPSLGEGAAWEAKWEAGMINSNKIAWRVASATTLIAAISVTGIVMLAPYSNRYIPFLLWGDRSTGNVEKVETLGDRSFVKYQELVDKSNAKKYVLARESYNYKLLQKDYDTVVLFSADDVGREYSKLFEGDKARDKVWSNKVEVTVEIISVTPSVDDVSSKMVVRFAKTIKHLDTLLVEPTQYNVATLAYEYAPTMFGKEKDLLDNPLGYRVIAYRVVSEMAPVAGGAK